MYLKKYFGIIICICMMMPMQIKPKNDLLYLIIPWISVISLATICMYLLKTNHDLNQEVANIKKKEKDISDYNAIPQAAGDRYDYLERFFHSIIDQVTKVNIKNYNVEIINDSAIQHNKLTINVINCSDIRYKIKNNCLYITTKQNMSYNNEMSIKLNIKKLDKLTLSGCSILSDKSKFCEQQGLLIIKLLDSAKIGERSKEVMIDRMIEATMKGCSFCNISTSKDIQLTISDFAKCTVIALENSINVNGCGETLLKVEGSCTLAGSMKGNSHLNAFMYEENDITSFIAFDNIRTQYFAVVAE